MENNMKKLYALLLLLGGAFLYAQEFPLISNAEDYMVLINHSGNDDTFRIKIRVPAGSYTKADANGFSGFSLKSEEQSDDILATYATCSLSNGQKKKIQGEFDWSKVNLVKIESKSGNQYSLNMYTRSDDLYIEILPFEDW